MTLALVTGTSSGIGLHTAIGLAKTGVTVIATVRDPSRADALRSAASEAGVELDIRALEVTDAAAAEALIEAVGPVDILVNNAGRGAVGTLEQMSDADLQAQLDTNSISPSPSHAPRPPGMRERGHGRIVTVTSVGERSASRSPTRTAGRSSPWRVSCSPSPRSSRAFGVDVAIVEPAAVASSFTDSVHRAPAGPYAAQQQAYLDRTATSFASAQSAQDAAQTVVEAATTADPRFRWQTSEAAVRFAGLSLADLDGSRVLGVTSGWVKPGE